MSPVVGGISWLIIGYLVYRVIRLLIKSKNGGATANATAEAIAEGGESASGATASVGGVHIHLHIGDGNSLSVRTNDDGTADYIVNPELPESRPLDSDGIRSLPNGLGNVIDASGNPARALPAGIPVRRPRRNHNLAVGE